MTIPIEESILRQRLRPRVVELCNQCTALHPANQNMLPVDPASIMRLTPHSIEDWLTATEPAVQEALTMSEDLLRDGLQDLRTFLIRPREPN